MWNLVRPLLVRLLGGHTVVLLDDRAFMFQLDHSWHDASSGLNEE